MHAFHRPTRRRKLIHGDRYAAPLRHRILPPSGNIQVQSTQIATDTMFEVTLVVSVLVQVVDMLGNVLENSQVFGSLGTLAPLAPLLGTEDAVVLPIEQVAFKLSRIVNKDTSFLPSFGTILFIWNLGRQTLGARTKIRHRQMDKSKPSEGSDKDRPPLTHK
jgi:hypothetical protein